ncbi:hypothetical protein ACLEEB_07760 [Lonsdalea quercina]|uniref:DUF2867 domain-containing protein n=1 Tax=Lonsdalea quercina TaxID=71657 RepID=A0A1H3XM26_9GAMM|nr:hypothetical protein [Lonsdalea quercina]SEA00487.1 hypothetical protein SAMN02982996_00698 [Lonsdalea quercina]
MDLIDTYLPTYHFSEKHALDVPSTPEHVMAAVLNYRPDNDFLFRNAITLREMPIRLFDRLQGRNFRSRKPFNMENFTLLEQRNNQDIVFGLAGKFWRSDYGQTPLVDAEDFFAFSEPASAKLTLSFSIDRLDNASIRLRTETRVLCLDKDARKKFAPYWYLIRPVSGLIRLRMLTSISQNAQHRAII